MPKGTLTVRVIGDARSLGRTLDTARGKVRGFASGVFAAGKKIALFGGAAAAGLAVAGQKVLDLGSQLEVMDQKAATVFGSQIGRVEKWAKANASAMGLTGTELKGLAGNFGDLLVPMGFTRKQAADMSTDVIGLSGALAEWSGGQRSASEVSEILAKAMLGEREALKGLGISITEADVKARLAKKGQEDLTGAALQQAKAIATQELLFEKSTDAQDAYAKGTFKLTRMQSQAKAAFKEFREKAVRALLPVVLKVATFLKDNLPKAINFVKGIIERWGPTVSRIFGTVRDAIGGFVDFVRGIFDTFRGAIGGGEGKVSEFGSRVREILSTVAGVFRSAFDAVRAVVETWVKIIRNLWDRFGQHIVKRIVGVWNGVMQVIGGALKIIKGIFDVFAGIFTGDWSRVWDGIKGILGGVWDAIKGVVRTAINAVSGIIAAVMGTISAAWSTAWNAVKTFTSDVWEGIKSAILGAVRFVVDKFLAAVEWIVRGAATAFGWVPKLGGKLKKAAKDFERFRDDVNDALGGITDREVTVRAALDLQQQGASLAAKGERLPAFHHGGVFRAPRPGGEGLALLRDREEVLTPAQARANRHGSSAVNERALAAAIAQAISGLVVEMDGERVGTLVARNLGARATRLARTS